MTEQTLVPAPETIRVLDAVRIQRNAYADDGAMLVAQLQQMELKLREALMREEALKARVAQLEAETAQLTQLTVPVSVPPRDQSDS